MAILSVFDGIGGIRRAFELAGTTPALFLTCEIDREAQRVMRRAWPDAFELGDIRDVKADDLARRIGSRGRIRSLLVSAGFPGQGMSGLSPSRNDLRDPRPTPDSGDHPQRTVGRPTLRPAGTFPRTSGAVPLSRGLRGTMATNPKTGGRPTQRPAGTLPRTSGAVPLSRGLRGTMATNPKTGGRPTLKQAGTFPITSRTGGAPSGPLWSRYWSSSRGSGNCCPRCASIMSSRTSPSGGSRILLLLPRCWQRGLCTSMLRTLSMPIVQDSIGALGIWCPSATQRRSSSNSRRSLRVLSV